MCNCEECNPFEGASQSISLNVSPSTLDALLLETFPNNGVDSETTKVFDITSFGAGVYIPKIDPDSTDYTVLIDKKFPNLSSAKKNSPYRAFHTLSKGANVKIFTFKGTKFLYVQLKTLSSFETVKEYVFYRSDEAIHAFAKELKRLGRSGKTITIYDGAEVPIKLVKKLPYVPPSKLLDAWNMYVKPQLDRKETYNHVLFYGRPGCGKTAFCRWLATQYPKWKFIFVPPQVVNKVGIITSIYEYAKRLSPAVVIFEDIDLIGQNRTDTSVNFTHALGELLNCLDGIEPHNQTLTIASTNNPESLDPAVTRAGRLGIPMTMEYSVDEKVKILRLYYPFPNLTDEQLAESIGIMARESPVDLKMIAKVYQIYEEYEKRKCSQVTLTKLAKMIANQEKKRAYVPIASADDGETEIRVSATPTSQMGDSSE